MLSFDLTLGAAKNGEDIEYWGYTSDNQPNIGSLTGLQPNTDIEHISEFRFEGGTLKGGKDTRKNSTSLSLYISSNQNSYQKVMALLNKTLYVTVDNVTYNLRIDSPGKIHGDNASYTCHVVYTEDAEGSEIYKLSDILKQQIGQTKHFSLKWSDN
ncbi:DUF7823 domain-containing protein [Xenorhabdus sp. BG5]|uniref:DUF7823 domain-containing protein n=1 Tax=Xenorhabdus sp. BG5 TaxID=2782014 RepID=UPI00187E9A24|nr:hypothetical protein [Xenorhabdus sp. BG5]MBE8596281.1 hypothetical protein [Xenorhabdus sp. BG5]